jgi:ketosteroid isomerase-like protein
MVKPACTPTAFSDFSHALSLPPAKAVKIDASDPHSTMSKAKKTVATVGGSADDIEATFYEALQTSDLDRLMACWADEDDVICIHPGGPRLIGLGAIRAAFEAMFANGSLRIEPQAVRKIEALTGAVHSVRERIDMLTSEGPVEAFVIATNVYHKTAQGWRLVAHHASPGNPREAQDITETPPVLH